MAGDRKFNPQALLKAGLSKALEAQYPAAADNVARLRRVHPNKTPAELVSLLNAYYLGGVTATGAGAGAAAIVPNGWIQVPVAAAELLTFLEASVFYTLSIAEIHGVDVEDVERRKLLVMAVLLGDGAAKSVLDPIIGRMVPYWGKKIVQAIPMPAINAANKVLGPRFITKWGTQQGALVLGKQVPMAIGVGIGAAGNHIFGRLIVKAARKILGPPPVTWGETETETVLDVPAADSATAVEPGIAITADPEPSTSTTPKR